MTGADDSWIWGGKQWACVGDAPVGAKDNRGKGRGGKATGRDASCPSGGARDSSVDRRRRGRGNSGAKLGAKARPKSTAAPKASAAPASAPVTAP